MRRVEADERIVPAWMVCEARFYIEHPGLDPDDRDDEGRAPYWRARRAWLAEQRAAGRPILGVMRGTAEHRRSGCASCAAASVPVSRYTGPPGPGRQRGAQGAL